VGKTKTVHGLTIEAFYMSFNTAIVYYKNKKDLRFLTSVFDVCWQWNLPAAEAAAEAAATAETAATAAEASEPAAEAVTPCQGLVGCY
jgi:hypothetical protein